MLSDMGSIPITFTRSEKLLQSQQLQIVDKAPNELYSFGAFLVSMILKFQRFRVICDIINV